MPRQQSHLLLQLPYVLLRLRLVLLQLRNARREVRRRWLAMPSLDGSQRDKIDGEQNGYQQGKQAVHAGTLNEPPRMMKYEMRDSG